MPIRILLVGAGSIGAFFGSRLATVSNVAVSALCRSNYQVVKDHGFKITSPIFGNVTFRPEYVFGRPSDALKSRQRWDFLLVATKALPDVSDDSSLIEGLVGSKTTIVLMQNGLGVEEPYRKRFPKATILSGVTMASTAQPSPGVIKHNRWTSTSIGYYLTRGDCSSQRDLDIEDARKQVATFVELLKAGGIEDTDAHDHDNMQFVRWHKTAINCAMNPSSVLSGGAGNQMMALDQDLNEHVQGVMNEVLRAASVVLGKPVPFDELRLLRPEQVLASVAKNTSGSRPSMWQDWEKGYKMELEVILGSPIKMAREKGIQLPRTQTMYALLKKAQQMRDQAGNKSKM